ncbi:sorbitol dehydrogenase family protein [Gluconobacter kondonii]|uniref:sorbitol dehydrogenase family protein n=1 Tax=Gluconobacter kondonii TaxID=941463 RepID=UPI00209CBAA3|nr:sorbitol dehydrogenase family protein [Gluconobacter kondonii]MCP1237349.1 sorbitol dehydrogenase family protein [Gluconobacter kondonii]
MKPQSLVATAVCQVSRRKLLFGGLAFGSMGVLASRGLTNTPKASDVTDFLILSEFLTGRKALSVTLARRYYVGLQEQFPDLPARIANLSRDIHASAAQTMDDYLTHGPSPEARSTATTIVSAWYLGVVGQDPKKKMIAYSDALMFQAVAGALVVPSYGAGPLAWGNRPKPYMTFKEESDEQ